MGKTIDTNADNLAEVGEPIGYELVVTNTGNVRISNVEVGGPAVVHTNIMIRFTTPCRHPHVYDI